MEKKIISIRELENRREELRAELVSLGDFRPGSLVQTYRRCGKADCRCARPGEQGHGPYWILTRPVEGKTVTRAISSPEAQERTREQLAEWRRFREVEREFVEVSDQICEAKLIGIRAASQDAAKKGGSCEPSRRKLPPK
jgi:hypothetical protein